MNKVKVLIISYSSYEYDGRLRELVEISQFLGETYLVSKDRKKIFENHLINYSKSNGYFEFLRFSYQAAKKIPGLSLIIADNRKALIPGQIIKRLSTFKIMTICDSRELYIIKDVKHLVGKIGCIIERLLYKKYDLVVCANRERARIMKKLYSLSEEPLVYENIRELYYSSSLDMDSIKEKFDHFFSDNSIKVVSTAGYSLSRGGKKLIEEVGLLGVKFSLYIVGGGKADEKKIYDALISDMNLSNVFDIGRLNSDELKYFIKNCDIGVVFYHNRDLNNRYCASGKVYEFLFEGLPIVCSSNAPLRSYCRKFQVGIAGESFSESLIQIVEKIDWYRENVRMASSRLDIKQNRKKIANEISSRMPCN
nr:hypothetical protein [uncultured Sphaerochaeta sp.]